MERDGWRGRVWLVGKWLMNRPAAGLAWTAPAAVGLFFLAGCAAHNSLEPIGGGKTGLQVGGGYPIYPVAEVRHGVTDWMDVSLGFHLPPLLEGDLGGGAMVAVFPFGVAPEKSWERQDWLILPTVGLQAAYDVIFIGDEGGQFSWTRVTPTLAWPTVAGTLYAGADFGWVETPWEQGDKFLFWKIRDPDPMWLMNPFLGHKFELSESFAIGLEGKLLIEMDDEDEDEYIAGMMFLTFDWTF